MSGNITPERVEELLNIFTTEQTKRVANRLILGLIVLAISIGLEPFLILWLINHFLKVVIVYSYNNYTLTLLLSLFSKSTTRFILRPALDLEPTINKILKEREDNV